MSAISLTNEERIQAIVRLGYSPREASFLCLAALHGGYFFRRQFSQRAGNDSAAMIVALTQKLLDQGHAMGRKVGRGIVLFHLASRPFYNAIGEPDNRNRREHSPLSIKTRLMGLDFILTHPGYRYLATEREKVEHFSELLGIPLAALPRKTYPSHQKPTSTTRYFVDKFPVFLKDTAANQPRPTPCFCYVDEGSRTLSGFETYLEQYAALWRGLPRFEVIYVGATARLFDAARRRFEGFAGRLCQPAGDQEARLAPRRTEHFEARLLYEKGILDSFDKDKLIRLRNEMQEFSSAEDQAAYERWKANGSNEVAGLMAPKMEVPAKREALFSDCLLKHCYDLLESE